MSSKIAVSRVYRIRSGSVLAEDITDVDPPNGGRLPLEAVTDFSPAADGETRVAKIDDEEIGFTDIDEVTDELVDITRAIHGTVAAAHTAGTFVQEGEKLTWEKFADGFIDDEDVMAVGVEIQRHLWRYYKIGERGFDKMEIATIDFREDGHPFITDAPEERDVSAELKYFAWTIVGGDLEEGMRVSRFPFLFAGTIEEAMVSMGIDGEPTGDSAIINLYVDDELAVAIEIEDGELDSPIVEADFDVSRRSIATIEIEQIGSTTPGSSPTLVIGVRPEE